MVSAKTIRPVRSNYRYFHRVTTRWHDNDAYGHVNNAIYYTYFDTVVNRFLIDNIGLDVKASPYIALVVASACEYHSAITFPNDVDAAMRVDRVGNSSVVYGVAIFEAQSDTASAHGTFTHVFVSRETGRPVSIPSRAIDAFSGIAASD